MHSARNRDQDSLCIVWKLSGKFHFAHVSEVRHIEMTDFSVLIIFKNNQIQKCHRCQLCVLRENSNSKDTNCWKVKTRRVLSMYIPYWDWCLYWGLLGHVYKWYDSSLLCLCTSLALKQCHLAKTVGSDGHLVTWVLWFFMYINELGSWCSWYPKRTTVK